ncbi:putative transcription factor interactor and regulator CCHC(Zn) family [Helianthus annuus]|nr:putative transcription factor interactor and regulator CCHC(Zn) family [Helianthus annuus]
MYFGGINTDVSTNQQPGLQTVFISNTNPYGQPFDPKSILPTPKPAQSFGPLTNLYGEPFNPKAYLPFPRAAPQQTQQQPSQPAPEQAFYGNNNSQQSNPNTVRFDTSNFTKVSVEGDREHIELLNTMVSAYYGLVAGQIGNINLTDEGYQQTDRDEMELMDIKWTFASAVRRAKDYMRRTGRTSLQNERDTKYGFNNDAVTCFIYGEKGHFKRECTRPRK